MIKKIIVIFSLLTFCLSFSMAKKPKDPEDTVKEIEKIAKEQTLSRKRSFSWECIWNVCTIYVSKVIVDSRKPKDIKDIICSDSYKAKKSGFWIEYENVIK